MVLQRMTVNQYRGQLLVERMRLQQEQVNRLTRELNDVRNEIIEIKAAQLAAKEKLDEAAKSWESGVIPERTYIEIRQRFEDFKRREPLMGERETRLVADLDQERVILSDLNKRLDALEREMMNTVNQDDQPKDRVKR